MCIRDRDCGLRYLSDCEANRLLTGVLRGVHGAIEVTALKDCHSFDRELALREHHHRGTTNTCHPVMNTHPMLRNLEHRVQERCIGRGKLRSGMVVPVEAQGKVV